jgi:hypothetical protein
MDILGCFVLTCIYIDVKKLKELSKYTILVRVTQQLN